MRAGSWLNCVGTSILLALALPGAGLLGADKPFPVGYASKASTANNPTILYVPVPGMVPYKVTVAIPSISQVVTGMGGTIANTGATVAQMEAASTAKANAIVAAANAQTAASKNAAVNAIMASVTGMQTIQLVPYGAPAGTAPVNVNIPVITFTNVAGTPMVSNPKVTMEGGDAKVVNPSIKPGMQGTIPSPGSIPPPTPGGSMGYSTGVDPDGLQSCVSFGLINNTNPSDPISFLASVFPTVGEDDEQVLMQLTGVFNADFNSDGYSATFIPQTDTLQLNQTLSDGFLVYSQDDDTGLGGDSNGGGYLDAFVSTACPLPTPAAGTAILAGLFLLPFKARKSIFRSWYAVAKLI
jgi:hypothetical protein